MNTNERWWGVVVESASSHRSTHPDPRPSTLDPDQRTPTPAGNTIIFQFSYTKVAKWPPKPKSAPWRLQTVYQHLLHLMLLLPLNRTQPDLQPTDINQVIEHKCIMRGINKCSASDIPVCSFVPPLKSKRRLDQELLKKTIKEDPAIYSQLKLNS